jgi:hypothetical protein
MGMVAHACNSGYSGGKGKRITFKAGLGKIVIPYLKNKLKAKGLEVWLRDGTLA